MPSGVDARERVLDVKWTFYLLLTCVYSVSGIAAAMYAVLLTEAVAFTSGLVRDGGRDACPCVISLLVVTVMMPDNYCVLLASFAVFLISLNERCRFSKKAIALCALAATYCLANVAANDVPLSNLVFWCVYLVPFPLLYFGLRRLFALDASLFGDAALMVKRLIALEAVSVVVYGATHLSVVASYGDMDWVVGTMGTYQANTLMCVAAFSLIVMLAEIKRGGVVNA